MRSEGNVTAGGPASVRGISIPLEPRPSGRDAVSDLERAHTPLHRIPTVGPEPQPITGVAENQCTACREYVVEDLSTRGWCDWCEQQAAAAIAPAADADKPHDEPRSVADLSDEQLRELESELVELEHTDSVVGAARVSYDRAVRKITQAAGDDADQAARVLRDTATSTHPYVRALRATALHVLADLGREHAAATLRSPKPDTEAPEAPRPRRPRARPASNAEREREIARLYTDEHLTAPQIAKRLGTWPKTIRDTLDRLGVARRDDRATNGPGRPRRTADEAFVRAAADQYANGSSITQIAVAMSTGNRQVRDALALAGVTLRPAKDLPGLDRAHALKARMSEAGVTSAHVRSWCRATGRDIPARGIPSAQTFEAYLAAHPTTKETA